MVKTAAAPASFEAAMTELEGIVATMESGELPLKESLAAYRRGDRGRRRRDQRVVLARA